MSASSDGACNWKASYIQGSLTMTGCETGGVWNWSNFEQLYKAEHKKRNTYTISYYTIPYYTIPYYTILDSILGHNQKGILILYHTIPYHTIPYHTILAAAKLSSWPSCCHVRPTHRPPEGSADKDAVQVSSLC